MEVSPNVRPPVCRIMDYGKWKYQQRKKEQKARSHSKQSELKEVRLRPKIDTHDLEIKTERAREFLGEGDKVQFTMLFRGREMAHQEIGLNQLRAIRDGLADTSKVESEPRLMGKRMTMVLAPDRKPKSAGETSHGPGSAPGRAAEGRVAGAATAGSPLLGAASGAGASGPGGATGGLQRPASGAGPLGPRPAGAAISGPRAAGASRPAASPPSGAPAPQGQPQPVGGNAGNR